MAANNGGFDHDMGLLYLLLALRNGENDDSPMDLEVTIGNIFSDKATSELGFYRGKV